MAFLTGKYDLKLPDSWAPWTFHKDQEEDIENCKQVFRDKFDILKIVHLELIAKSLTTYPEMSAQVFISSIVSR